MADLDKEKLTKTAKTLTSMGRSLAITQVQSMVMPHVMETFAEYDEETVRRMIVTDYDLVREQTPAGVKKTLHNLGTNPEIRQEFEGVVLTTITPENVLDWLRNPEEWLDEEEAEVQRERMQRCAEMIEETEGGMAWLERQVFDLYRLAQLVPEDSTPARADD